MKYVLIALISIMISISLTDYMQINSSKEQMLIVLSGLIGAISYLAIVEIWKIIDKYSKK